MILHLLTDDKFADYAIKQFSAPEMESEFVLVPSNGAMDLVELIDQCTVVRQNSPEFDALLNRLNQYTGIVFNGLFWGQWQTPILRLIPSHVKVAWYFWGGEIYSRSDMEELFLAPITCFVYRLHGCKKKTTVDNSWQIPFDLYKRVDYCLTSMREESDFAKQYAGASFEHLWYTCYSLEETIGPLMNSRCDGTNIWVGNSAGVENNHLDVLWKLRKSGVLHHLESRKVIIPLSYGTPWVRNMVMQVCKWIFGNRMKALTQYMPRKEYNALMLSCSTMILGYWEPAGQGNIVTALWLGMRVYLSEKSLAYSYYKRIGAKVFSIESDLKKHQFIPLSEEERATNREVLWKWYGKQHVMEAVQNVVSALQ